MLAVIFRCFAGITPSLQIVVEVLLAWAHRCIYLLVPESCRTIRDPHLVPYDFGSSGSPFMTQHPFMRSLRAIVEV